MIRQSSKQSLVKPTASEAWNTTVEHIHTSDGSIQRNGHNASLVTLSTANSNPLVRGRQDKRFIAKKKARSHPDRAISVEQPQASTAKLKGRLGHLVTAIAESHDVALNPSSSGADSVGMGRETRIESEPLHVHSNAWVSASSSLDSIEVHMCSKCDRMYSNRIDLEHHQAICSS